MNLEVFKEDLNKIGHTQYQEDGNVCIVCQIQTAHLEEILLRKVLKCFGEYQITDTEDFDDDEVKFKTNLPWKLAHV